MTADRIAAMAQWVADFELADCDTRAVAVARDCITDGLGVALAGTRTEIWRACVRLAATDAGPCSVWSKPQRVQAQAAAFLNGAALHALDFDDTCYAGIVHGTAAVLPAAWAACESRGGDGASLLAAFICGVEIEYALGLALTDAVYHRGYWSTATLGIVGAAAGAAKALELSPAQIGNALSLALAMPVGLRSVHGANAKPYLVGMVARLGLEAALAAREGIACPPGALSHRFGFQNVVGTGAFDDDVIVQLGKRYSLVDPGVAFKLYPLCSATQAAIEATLALRERHGIDPSKVAHIECISTRLGFDSLPYLAPRTASEAQFSMSFAISCALLRGRVGVADLDSGLRDPAMLGLMPRLQLSAGFHDHPAAGPESACVTLIMLDGTRHQCTIMHAQGMPQQPLAPGRLAAKFRDCTRDTLTPEQAANFLDHLSGLERCSDLRNLLPTGYL